MRSDLVAIEKEVVEALRRKAPTDNEAAAILLQHIREVVNHESFEKTQRMRDKREWGE